jgi:hypothetical protein
MKNGCVHREDMLRELSRCQGQVGSRAGGLWPRQRLRLNNVASFFSVGEGKRARPALF